MPNAPSNVYFKALDFFNFDIPDEKFSIAYDYTFFVALPPDMRASWGKRYAEIVTPGGKSLIFLMEPECRNLEAEMFNALSGILITLIWPIAGDRPGGPPYSVSPSTYEPFLSKDFESVSDRRLRRPQV